MPATRISTAIRAEQLRAVFRQMPIALAVNLVNAALTAAVLFPLAARPLPLMWFSSVALVTTGRWLLWRAYRRAFPERQEMLGWPALAICGSLAAGLCWGIGGMLLFPIVPASGQMFLAFVIGGMCTGAVVLSAPHLPTLLAFLLSGSLPMAVLFFARATAADTALAAMIVVFAAALSLAGVHLNRFFTEAMRLRFELNEANLHLQAEIAEHRATEAALRQAQKLEAVGQLTGGIAHDFNNLLTVVIGNLELASSRAGQNSALLPLLQSASRAAERGVALVQRLLAFARRQRLDPRPVDLAVLIRGMEGLLKQTLGPVIRLEIVADDNLAPAEVDANQVELAILNLAINSRDAMPEGGKLRIELHNRRAGPSSPGELTPGEYVLLSIVDTGIGMDEATLAQAFDPFFTTKEAGSGSGLGLSMVQGFALQSGGAVQIRSTPGEGTAVKLWLPQANDRAETAGGDEGAAPDLPPGKASILVCDDDDEVLRFLSEFLTSNGYSVHESNSPEGALRLLESGLGVDLLIVDYAMPGINGVETIERARRLRPGLRALLITGHAGAPAAELTDAHLLRKPFGLAALSQTVAEILAA
jgi:signal transduction histidine kinase/CheY-like chemotaxis protein